MLNYHHEPTNTRIETDTGETATSGRSYEEIKIQSGVVGMNVTTFEPTVDHPAFDVHNVHVHTGGVPDPESIRVNIRHDGNGDGYIAITTAPHTTVYLPMDVAEAIAAAFAAEAVAS